MKAIRVYRTGGPEVLVYEEIDIRKPGRGEVRVRNRAIGVNYTDVYLRKGTFPPPEMPFTLGKEGAGEVVAIGDDVTDFAIGDRVAYVETLGAYAEECIVPVHYLVPLPEDIDFETAAAMMLKGLTAQYLVRRTFLVGPGHTILMHAAAGGVGQILAQWAKHLGATVIGTVGSQAKVEVARQNGCDHVIEYTREDVPSRVKQITKGKGCDVVYDAVGQATFPASLDCLRPLGFFVSFGAASGSIAPVDLKLLAEKGSLFATWQVLPTHLATRDDVLANSQELFDVVASGAVKIHIRSRMPLAEAPEAHRRLEGRQTTGATVMFP
ncbi:quinone oxidoreductase family protein [Paraburkholderia sp. SIMBA_030]|uniref:quinone oxidoreductase family protein n=1 Tax=Paraburkholderia sp. SIMBA_030 TaxID=3085773 RepID=UPI0039793677